MFEFLKKKKKLREFYFFGSTTKGTEFSVLVSLDECDTLFKARERFVKEMSKQLNVSENELTIRDVKEF